MFLRKYKPTINSVRFKKIIDSSLTNIRKIKAFRKSYLKTRIKNKHKFMSNSNTIHRLNLINKFHHGIFIILNHFKISYGNKLYGYALYGDGSITVKPLCYGFNYSKIYKNSHYNLIKIYSLKIKKKKKLFLTYNNLYSYGINTIFYQVSDHHKNWQFATSAGTYCLYLNFNQNNGMLLVKIPSKKRMLFDQNIMGFLGRNANIYCKNLFYTSFKQKFILKKKKQTVRGIAMNPIDHPNGGSSKTKRPMKTP